MNLPHNELPIGSRGRINLAAMICRVSGLARKKNVLHGEMSQGENDAGITPIPTYAHQLKT
jgi:hypothetical protein